VRDGDTRQIQILGPNQVIFSSLGEDEAVGFYDKYNNMPAVLAAMVTGDDPVIQELVGRISRVAGGVAASAKDEDARKFLLNLYAFFTNNSISYQTPPGGKFGTHSAQSIKFGRDVIRNRAGTCVDMALLFASACEGVGLKPILYLTSGHCLPGVRLPGGDILQVEMTGVASDSFAKATEAGATRVKEARTKGELYEIDVAKWRSLGVQSLDLQQVSGYLENCRFVASTESTTSSSSSTSTSTSTSSGSKPSADLVGRWTLESRTGSVTTQYSMELKADGKYSYRATATGGTGGPSEASETGTVQQDSTWLKFFPDGGKATHTYFYKLRGDELELQLQGTSTPATFRRAR